MTPLPCPLHPNHPVSGPWAAPPAGGGSWFPGRQNGGGGWYSYWCGLSGSICHPGCPVNYSAAVRTDSTPNLQSSPESFLLFPLLQAHRCLCLGGLNPCPRLLSSGRLSLGICESLPAYFLLFILSLSLSHCLVVSSIPTIVLSIQMWKLMLR